MILDEPLSELRLSSSTTPDGKKIITLEDYLALYLRHPKNTQVTLRLNCSSILKLLDVFPAGQHETKRAATGSCCSSISLWLCSLVWRCWP